MTLEANHGPHHPLLEGLAARQPAEQVQALSEVALATAPDDLGVRTTVTELRPGDDAAWDELHQRALAAQRGPDRTLALAAIGKTGRGNAAEAWYTAVDEGLQYVGAEAILREQASPSLIEYAERAVLRQPGLPVDSRDLLAVSEAWIANGEPGRVERILDSADRQHILDTPPSVEQEVSTRMILDVAGWHASYNNASSVHRQIRRFPLGDRNRLRVHLRVATISENATHWNRAAGIDPHDFGPAARTHMVGDYLRAGRTAQAMDFARSIPRYRGEPRGEDHRTAALLEIAEHQAHTEHDPKGATATLTRLEGSLQASTYLAVEDRPTLVGSGVYADYNDRAYDHAVRQLDVIAIQKLRVAVLDPTYDYQSALAGLISAVESDSLLEGHNRDIRNSLQDRARYAVAVALTRANRVAEAAALVPELRTNTLRATAYAEMARTIHTRQTVEGATGTVAVRNSAEQD